MRRNLKVGGPWARTGRAFVVQEVEPVVNEPRTAISPCPGTGRLPPRTWLMADADSEAPSAT